MYFDGKCLKLRKFRSGRVSWYFILTLTLLVVLGVDADVSVAAVLVGGAALADARVRGGRGVAVILH